MAWTAPPTFTDGNVLSASQLNVLVEDLNYLRGLVAGASMPFPGFYTTDGGSYYVPLRHVYNTLEIKFEGVNLDDIRIYYGATEVYHDGDPDTGVYTIDLTPFGLVANAFYRVRIELSMTGGGWIQWWWLGEKP